MRLAIALVFLVGSSSWVRADDGPPSEAPPGVPMPAPVIMQPQPLPPPPPPPRLTTVDQGTLDDASSGHVAIMPTALTPPAGTWSFEDDELLMIGVSYAVTDQLLISATTMIPVTSDFYWGFLSGKLQVLKQGPLRAAIQVGVGGVVANSTDVVDNNGMTTSSTTSDSASGAEVAGTATYCLDDGCYSHLDGAVVAGFAHQNQASVPVAFMGGLVARISNHVRLVAEADTAHLFGDISGQANGLLAWYGVRFTSRQIAVDLELVKPFCANGDCDGGPPIGLPWVSFTYRGLN
ncbi:MAG: hypothetical protein ABI467_29320 [Kofleriaceae bacterium]